MYFFLSEKRTLLHCLFPKEMSMGMNINKQRPEVDEPKESAQPAIDRNQPSKIGRAHV